MNRIAILDGYDSGPGFGDMSAYWRRDKRGHVRRHGKVTKKQRRQGSRLARAARACAGRTKGKFKKCMSRKLRRR